MLYFYQHKAQKGFYEIIKVCWVPHVCQIKRNLDGVQILNVLINSCGLFWCCILLIMPFFFGLIFRIGVFWLFSSQSLRGICSLFLFLVAFFLVDGLCLCRLVVNGAYFPIGKLHKTIAVFLVKFLEWHLDISSIWSFLYLKLISAQ